VLYRIEYYLHGKGKSMNEELTVMTRKGQITVPANIRRLLNLKVGDKVAIALVDGDPPRATLRPVISVADMTFGSVTPRKRPEDMEELRGLALEEIAQNAAAEGMPDSSDPE
jgi:AbrB family looped-hinge helix DNA binding protein